MITDPRPEAVEAAARVLAEAEGELTTYSPDAHPDHNRWSWLGDGHDEAFKDHYRVKAQAAILAALPILRAQFAEEVAGVIVARAAQVYPPDVFVPPTGAQYAEINALLKRERGHMLDGITGDVMRRAHAGIVHEIRNDFEGFMARAATPPGTTTEKEV